MLARFLLALLIGLPIGAWTAWSAIRTDIGIGALSVGPWTAWPDEGSQGADPYTRAKVAARGTVPLGIGEGVAFEALADSSGQPLMRRCDYAVSGRTPKARIWTLTAHDVGQQDRGGEALTRPDGEVAALTSRDLVRGEDGSFTIAIGPTPGPGDRIVLRPAKPAAPPALPQRLRIVLRLYDSPVSTSAELFEPTMPSIERRGCSA